MNLFEQTEAGSAAMHLPSLSCWNDVRMLLCRDEENPYLAAKAPMAGGPPTMGQRFWKELRQNWWLWGSVVFAILLVGGLLLFRNQLYDSATHGLPFLAGRPPVCFQAFQQMGYHLNQHPLCGFPMYSLYSNTSVRQACSCTAWEDHQPPQMHSTQALQCEQFCRRVSCDMPACETSNRLQA